MTHDHNADIAEEGRAFDEQIRERIAGGHIPDLRRVEDCDWFHDNPWRRKAYVELDFGQIFERVRDAFSTYCPETERLRVLEVGSGPGYMSLELARNGHNVTGIDPSVGTLAVAQELADSDPWKSERGNLNYIVGDFLTDPAIEGVEYDAVIFIGSLHHIGDQTGAMKRAHDLLRHGGLVVAHEPTRDRFTEGTVVFTHFIRTLLSVGGGYFKDVPIPANEEERRRDVEKLLLALKFETEEGDKVQSPNDNDAGYAEMHGALTGTFDTLHEEDTYAFFHETIGGLRFDEETNAKLARFIRDTDAALVKHGILPATEFFFVGRRR